MSSVKLIMIVVCINRDLLDASDKVVRNLHWVGILEGSSQPPFATRQRKNLQRPGNRIDIPAMPNTELRIDG